MDLAHLLMVIILFVFFEGLQGHEASCWQHLLSAVRIRSERPHERSELLSSCVGPILDRMHGTARVMVLPDFLNEFPAHEGSGPMMSSTVSIMSLPEVKEHLEMFVAPALRQSIQPDSVNKS